MQIGKGSQLYSELRFFLNGKIGSLDFLVVTAIL